MRRLGRDRELVRSELLSFHFAAEEQQEREYTGHGSRRVRVGAGAKQGPRSSACLANHRFLVHPWSTWVAGSVPQWEGIAAVEVIHDEVTRLFPHCAICMDFADPQLARITRCGHIYCMLCLLRHLSYEGAANCPVCQEVLLERDLKRVLFQSCSQVPKDDREFTFRLVAVSKRGAVWPVQHGIPTPESRLSRCFAATAQGIGRQIESEETYLLRLKAQFEENSDQDDRYDVEYLPFIASALLSIRDEREKNINNTTSMKVDEEFNELEPEAAPTFYQAETGDVVFLHPMNRKCLLSLSSVPSTFSSKVLEVERVILCPDQKKKLNFLRHLPLNAEVFLVEVELSSLVADAAAIEPFLSDIQKREKARVERSKKLRKEKRADEEKVRLEKKKWVERQEQLTQSCKELFTGPVVGSTSSSSDIALPPSSAEEVVHEEQEEVSAFTFASIAREGGNFPTLSLGNPKPPPPPPQSSVWGVVKAPIAQQTAEAAAPQKGKVKFKKGEALALFSNSSTRSYK